MVPFAKILNGQQETPSQTFDRILNMPLQIEFRYQYQKFLTLSVPIPDEENKLIHFTIYFPHDASMWSLWGATLF